MVQIKNGLPQSEEAQLVLSAVCEQSVAPVDNQYFENITPVTGKVFCEVPRSTAADIHRR